MSDIRYRLCPEVSDETLNALFAASWRRHQPRPFAPVLDRSLAYVCAYQGEKLVGFVNLAWDGGVHAFLLDTTVHRRLQRRGIGRQLVRHVVEAARAAGIAWVHVDFEPRYAGFYAACGFADTRAGLLRIEVDEAD